MKATFAARHEDSASRPWRPGPRRGRAGGGGGNGRRSACSFSFAPSSSSTTSPPTPTASARWPSLISRRSSAGGVEVDKATLSIFEGLRLDGVRIYVDDGESIANPPRNTAIFSAQTFVVRYHPRSILLGELEATQIIAQKPQVRLVEDVDRREWNFQRLGKAPRIVPPTRRTKRAPRLPELLLRNARVQITELRGGKPSLRGHMTLDGRFSPSEEAGRYVFALQSRGANEGLGPRVTGRDVARDRAGVGAASRFPIRRRRARHAARRRAPMVGTPRLGRRRGSRRLVRRRPRRPARRFHRLQRAARRDAARASGGMAGPTGFAPARIRPRVRRDDAAALPSRRVADQVPAAGSDGEVDGAGPGGDARRLGRDPFHARPDRGERPRRPRRRQHAGDRRPHRRVHARRRRFPANHIAAPAPTSSSPRCRRMSARCPVRRGSCTSCSSRKASARSGCNGTAPPPATGRRCADASTPSAASLSSAVSLIRCARCRAGWNSGRTKRGWTA